MMKKIAIVVILLMYKSAFAVTYYIDPDGDDLEGFGTKSFPWKTLEKACAVARFVGDTIHVNSGVYTVSQSCELAENVTIIGEGESSVLVGAITSDWTGILTLNSSLEGTKGNQSISNLTFDGNKITWQAIIINARSNVKIHDCTFKNFRNSGVTFNGKVGLYDPTVPINYATDNEFYNNIMLDCSEHVFESHAAGALKIGGQEGILIHDNIIIQDQRPDGYNGYCIKYHNNGYNKGIKIYNNTLKKNEPSDYSWDYNFAIELWFSRGGNEIFNNRIFGSLDIAHSENGEYDFGFKVYNNTFGYDTLQDCQIPRRNAGIYLERGIEDIYIERNVFNNVTTPIKLYPSADDYIRNIYITYNLFYNVGAIGGSDIDALIKWSTVDGQQNVTIENFNIFNNTAYGGTDPVGTGFRMPDIGAVRSFNFQNNIVYGFANYAFTCGLSGNSSIDQLSIKNNLFYNNENNEFLITGYEPTNYTNTNNLYVDPEFNSSVNLRLQEGSAAIGAGIKIEGLTRDIDGLLLKEGAPNIGCYEWGIEMTSPTYQNSAVREETPNIVEIQFNMKLHDVLPDYSAFTLKINNEASKIKGVSIKDDYVFLQLTDNVTSNDLVTVSYTVPSENPLQSVQGVAAGSFLNQIVTNSVQFIESKLHVFPNPTNGDVSLNIRGDSHDLPVTFKFYSYTGSLTYEINADRLPYNFALNNRLNSGLYFVQVVSENKVLDTKKMVYFK